MKIRLNQRNIPILATFGVFILIYLIGSLMYRNFFTLRVFSNLFYDNAFVGVIAVGMTFVIVSGGIDLSVGSVIGFTCVFMARLVMEYQVHPMVAILLSLVIGAILGFTMGYLIHYFELPPFLVTLVGMFLMRGLAFQVTLESIPIRHDLVDKIVYFGIPLTKRVSFSGSIPTSRNPGSLKNRLPSLFSLQVVGCRPFQMDQMFQFLRLVNIWLVTMM